MSPGLAVYVHFPYCSSKCPYCDFASRAVPRNSIPHEAYAQAVVTELEERYQQLESPGRIRTLYFGGGTPSLWDPTELGRVVDACARIGGLRPGEDEISVECNPSSLTDRQVRVYVDVGVSRLSIGMQSTRNQWLKLLGREHDAQQGVRAVEMALQAGFRSVSVDLIHGLPGQSPDDAAEQAREVARLGVSHVSAYLLTIHPGTVFGRDVARGRMSAPIEDMVAASYLAVAGALEQEGLLQYEVSNFARAGYQCEHHLMVWQGDPYLGLGAGAVGTVRTKVSDRPVRWRNRHAANWSELVAGSPREWWKQGALVEEMERLSVTELLTERLMLGLRLRQGVDIVQLEKSYGVTWWNRWRRRQVERLVEMGRLERNGSRLRIPFDAMIWENDTISRLI